ncbi:MAG TPA: hypothetical protein VHO69_01350 [Phototrophicaceae bacterium]|nr:hypothetical protein [Phototrophicaceae bacterium]
MDAAPRRPILTFTFLELLDRTFRIYRENFLTFVGLTALVTIPITVINQIVALSNFQSVSNYNSYSSSSSMLPAMCFASVISIVAALLQAVLINAPITYITSENQLGRKVSIGEAFRGTQHRFSNLGCGFILFYVVVMAFGIAIGLLSAACNPAIVAFGLVAYIGIATYAFLVPILTLENVGTSFGVNRAWALGKARFWTVTGFIVAISVITFIISLAFSTVAQWLILQFLASTASQTTYTIAMTVLSTFLSIFTIPLMPIGLTLLYYDTRTRVEGLDIAFESAENPSARPWDVDSPPVHNGLTGKDLVNILILTVGVVIITALAGAALSSLFSQYLPGLNLPR